MPAQKQAQAEPKRFEQIIAERMPKQPSTRERLATAIERRAEAQEKIDAQAAQREERERLTAKIARRHKPGTSDFYRAVAKAEQEARA